jgi:integrase
VDHTNLNARSFEPPFEQAGLPSIRFHDLRHTCATLLLSKDVHPKVVAEVLGHASVTITLDTYSHVLPDMQGGPPPRWTTPFPGVGNKAAEDKVA